MSNIALPYPVLGRGDDYLDVDFQVALQTKDLIVDRECEIELPYAFDLSDESIDSLIRAGSAKFGFEISCSSTSTRYVELADSEGVLKINPRKFFRQVTLRPRVFVVESIKGFRSPNFNPEFRDSVFDFEAGDFLAAVDDENINIDFQYLKFEDAAIVKRSTELDPWVYNFGLGGDAIIIGMGIKYHEFWTLAKENREISPFLISSVYKDCLVAALEQICDGTAEESLSWVKGLHDMLESNNIKLPNSPSFLDLNKIAQDLIKSDGIKKVKL
ncbi:hypothetical protein N9Z60_04900 [Gammaproteobacteria bacterium]|nr:hypothetical protein [Gammaproteobacteria bacterium]